jgi:hypothetical protein
MVPIIISLAVVHMTNLERQAYSVFRVVLKCGLSYATRLECKISWQRRKALYADAVSKTHKDVANLVRMVLNKFGDHGKEALIAALEVGVRRQLALAEVARTSDYWSSVVVFNACLKLDVCNWLLKDVLPAIKAA